MKNIVYFDLETRRSAAEVGGWHNTGKMGISAAVTYSSADDKYNIYTEEEVGDLIEELRRADLVVGYNHIHFDYGVLQPHTLWNMVDNTSNLDLCRDIETIAGKRLNLDSVATATLGTSKTADGLLALKWWAEYQKTGDPQLFMEIARYCCFDVKVTREVFLYGAEHGKIFYNEKNGGELCELAVDWGKYLQN